MIEVEQLSLFTMLSPVPPAVAVCCMDGSRVDAAPAESWIDVYKRQFKSSIITNVESTTKQTGGQKHCRINSKKAL